MDAIVAQILNALAVGAIAAGTEIASTAVKDAYNGLKVVVASLLKREEPAEESGTGNDMQNDPAEIEAGLSGLPLEVLQELQKKVDKLYLALNEQPIATELKQDPRVIVTVGANGQFEYKMVNLAAESAIRFSLGDGASAKGETFIASAGKGN